MPQVGGAEIEVAVLVHRTGLEDDDVRRGHEPPVVVGDLAEIDGDVVAAPLVVFLPVVAGEVQAERMDVIALGVGVQHGTRPHRQAVADLDVRELRGCGRPVRGRTRRAGTARYRSPATCPRRRSWRRAPARWSELAQQPRAVRRDRLRSRTPVASSDRSLYPSPPAPCGSSGILRELHAPINRGPNPAPSKCPVGVCELCEWNRRWCSLPQAPARPPSAGYASVRDSTANQPA